MKQTAVEYLIKNLEIFNLIKDGDLENELFRQIELDSKEMEKQQIIDAWEDGQNSFPTRNAKKYYNETFKNK